MLKKLVIAENSLEPESWKTFECEDLLEFLKDYYGVWPENTRIYHNEVSEISDVTPSNKKDIENLSKLEGMFYVITYPGAWWVPYVVMLIVAVVMIAIMPKVPVATERKDSESPSSNNELSGRTNKSRVNGRIPDIFGQVRSVPDLLGAPYSFFEDSIEHECSYMCVGRGEYDITDVKEDTTLVSELSSSCDFYGPNTSPNSGDLPFLFYGPGINRPIKNISRMSAVNGQVLDYNANNHINESVRFTHLGTIDSSENSNFDTLFPVGSIIVVNALYIVEIENSKKIIYNFSGNYIVDSVATDFIHVSNATSNRNWKHLIENQIDSEYIAAEISKDSADSVGPFYINNDDNTEIWINCVAPNGIYKDDGITKTPFDISIDFKIAPVDNLNKEIGPEEIFTQVLRWNGKKNLYVGSTLKIIPSFVGRCKIKGKRATPTLTGSNMQIYQEVKWKDLYAVSPLVKTHFGNVTTVQILTIGDSGSLSVKERKFNLLATRKIPKRLFGQTFSTELYATKRADEIISFVCLDKRIGNRVVNELDLDNIYGTIAEIEEYFGTSKAVEFCYTFDSTNISFEETLSSIANCIFSLAYRKGNKIKLSFEKLNNIATILFNHRNKIPGSETRTVSFGNVNENDGIEYKWVDPTDDAIVSIYLPEDKSAYNPSVVESIGVRNARQAHFNACRLYNKIKYQNTSIEIEATQEAAICVLNDKVLISDGTRVGIFEGEVVSQNALEIELSQNIALVDGVSYTIFLQLYDGTVDSIPITKTSVQNKVILSRAPVLPLCLDFDLYAKTTFIITSNDDIKNSAFILTEKKPKGVMTSELTAMNYDARYYKNDTDFINNIIP